MLMHIHNSISMSNIGQVLQVLGDAQYHVDICTYMSVHTSAVQHSVINRDEKHILLHVVWIDENVDEAKNTHRGRLCLSALKNRRAFQRVTNTFQGIL